MVYIFLSLIVLLECDFNNRKLILTAKLLKQGYRYHKIRKAFSKFYHSHSELIVKYNIGLKTLLQQGISEPIFYDDLVYKFKRIVGKPNFSDQFKNIVKRFIKVECNLDVMHHSACLIVKVSNGAKIRNRYNQVPHLTQDTNGKVTNSQKIPQTRAKRSALSQQVTTKHISTQSRFIALVSSLVARWWVKPQTL